MQAEGRLFWGRVELLSWKPRAFLYHNFLSAAECQHIIQEAKPMVPTCARVSVQSTADACRQRSLIWKR